MILFVLWALGLVTSYTIGGYIHILLVVAVIVVLVRVIRGRRVREDLVKRLVAAVSLLGSPALLRSRGRRRSIRHRNTASRGRDNWRLATWLGTGRRRIYRGGRVRRSRGGEAQLRKSSARRD